MSTIADIKGWASKQRLIDIQDKLGPNPCTELGLINAETGDEIQVPCDRKHCRNCGPRKKATLKHQLKASLGTYTWVARTHNRTELDRALAKIKKACQRSNTEFLYQIVGDEYLGYIVTSDIQILPEQRRMKLDDWLDRIVDTWMRADDRIRRTRRIGRLSLVPYRRNTEVGTSPWARIANRFKTRREAQLEQQIARRDALIKDIGGWHVWEEHGKWVSTISAWSIDD